MLLIFQRQIEKISGPYGVGLGLPLAKLFIEMHEGSIWLDSEEKIGTTVVIKIPKKRLVRKEMIILGIDPGLQHTGWGVIESNGDALRFIAAGVINTST
jgi:hypothetical protein